MATLRSFIHQGHRVVAVSPHEHHTLRALGCQGSICASCGCCVHCDDCICPTGPCQNKDCGCWIMDRSP